MHKGYGMQTEQAAAAGVERDSGVIKYRTDK